MLAGVVTVAGGASLAFALLQRWNMGEMAPSMEGTLTVGVLAPLLARLHGFSYQTTVALTLAILAIQFAAFQAIHGQPFGILGLELTLTGILGLGSALRAADRALQSAQAQARRTSDAASASPQPAPF